MAIKTYHLVDNMQPKMSNIYYRVNKDQRIRHDKLPAWRPYMQITFTDKDGNNKTIRYKSNTNEIFQDEQIKKGILANEKTLMSERDDLEFKNGVLATANPTAQKFLETYPGFEGFQGYCNDIRQPQYKLHDADKEIESDNSDFLKRLKVGQMVAGMDLKAMQELLLRLNGSNYIVPDKLSYAQNQLVKWMNDAEEDGLDEMLKTTMTEDEIATVLIGKLMNAGLIEFDFIEGQVIKKKNGREIAIKNIAADSVREQQRLFIEHITSDAGKALYEDLERDLKAATAVPTRQAVYEETYIPPQETQTVVVEEKKVEQVEIAVPEKNVAAVVNKPVAAKKKRPKKKPKPRYSAAPKPVVKQEEIVNTNIQEPENVLDHGM